MKTWLKHLGLLLLVALFLFRGTGRYHPVFDLNTASKIQVMHDGRIKPLDAVARHSLLIISGKQAFTFEGKKISAMTWFMNTLTDPEISNTYPIFLINHPGIAEALRLEKGKKRYTRAELQPAEDTISRQANEALKREDAQRTPYQKEMVNLYSRMATHVSIQHSFFIPGRSFPLDRLAANALTEQEHRYVEFLNAAASIHAIPPSETHPTWHTIPHLLHIPHDHNGPVDIHPLLPAYNALLDAYRLERFESFKTIALSILDKQAKNPLLTPSRPHVEQLLNYSQPFSKAIALYLLSVLALVISWSHRHKFWAGLANGLMQWTFALHTSASYFEFGYKGAPPVTNLFSSAIFVGWAAVLMGLLMEKRFKNQVGLFIAAIIGAFSLIIAHHLALQGDTMEAMRAVLDTNFWLSTHVITVTIGYSAAFVAGTFALIYILQGVYTKSLTAKLDRELGTMVYAAICFCLFFSFVGTVLGGIWADQSWGRFWGWDPKENGALLIVLWSAAILHAKMGGLLQRRGIMISAVFGNIVTAFSWFGVNMLGIGLHSYGFMNEAFRWLLLFTVSQLLVMAIGAIPKSLWKSSQVPKR